MSGRLESIIEYVLSKFPRGVGRTRLMKILFLVDYEAYKMLGRTITGIRWVRLHYGPFSKEVLEALDELEEQGEVAIDPGVEVRYFYVGDREPELPPLEKEVIDRVVREYGFLYLESLLELVYNIIGDVEKGSIIDFERLSKGDIKRTRTVSLEELAARASEDDEAVKEIVARLVEDYGELLKSLHPSLLVIYVMAIIKAPPDKARRITKDLITLLKEAKDASRNGERVISPELRRRAKRLLAEMKSIVIEG